MSAIRSSRIRLTMVALPLGLLFAWLFGGVLLRLGGLVLNAE